jgi:hypothetical protein
MRRFLRHDRSYPARRGSRQTAAWPRWRVPPFERLRAQNPDQPVTNAPECNGAPPSLRLRRYTRS